MNPEVKQPDSNLPATTQPNARGTQVDQTYQGQPGSDGSFGQKPQGSVVERYITDLASI